MTTTFISMADNILAGNYHQKVKFISFDSISRDTCNSSSWALDSRFSVGTHQCFQIFRFLQ
jgi:hypothetical protein